MENKYFGKIIDTHAHIYPDKVAERAVKAIGEFYNIPMAKGGSVSGLIESGRAAGVRKYVVHSLATTVHQVHAINNFILEAGSQNPSFVPFATLHPDMSEDDMQREMERVIPLGMRGLKLHPDFQKFYVDDENVYKLYRVTAGKIPILFHAGDNRFDYSAPERIKKIAELFPNLTVIAAHFGGYQRWDSVGIYKGLANVYFDTSSSLFALSPQKAEDIIGTLGADRFFFASDYPMWDHMSEVSNIMRLSLTDEEREKIFFANAERVLGI